jgi:hypothetical protein
VAGYSVYDQMLSRRVVDRDTGFMNAAIEVADGSELRAIVYFLACRYPRLTSFGSSPPPQQNLDSKRKQALYDRDQ